jgi:hypothetical protein
MQMLWIVGTFEIKWTRRQNGNFFRYKVSLRKNYFNKGGCLLNSCYDLTNFLPFIDTINPLLPLPSEGITNKNVLTCINLDWTMKKTISLAIGSSIWNDTSLYQSRRVGSRRDCFSAYRGQYHIEHLFRHLKNPYYLSEYPQYHWIDSNSKVQPFVCREKKVHTIV